jgi:hypothetical protein
MDSAYADICADIWVAFPDRIDDYQVIELTFQKPDNLQQIEEETALPQSRIWSIRTVNLDRQLMVLHSWIQPIIIMQRPLDLSRLDGKISPLSREVTPPAPEWLRTVEHWRFKRAFYPDDPSRWMTG